MSLINKMLQDLESRRASLAGEAGLSQGVRPLPPPRATVTRTTALGGVALLLTLAAAALWWVFGGMPVETGGVQANADQPAPAAPAAVTLQPPLPQPPLPQPPLPQPPLPQPPLPQTPLPQTPLPQTPSPQTPSPQPSAAQAEPAQAAPAAPQPSAAPAASAQADPVRSAPEAAASSGAAAVSPSLPLRPADAPSLPRPPTVTTKKRPSSSGPLADMWASLKMETALAHITAEEGPAAADEGRIEKKMRLPTPRERAEHAYRRGLERVNQGRIEDGMAALRAALIVDAEHTGARLTLFALLVEQQRNKEARALLQEALARDPGQPQFAFRLARLQLEDGDVRGAEQTLSRSAAAAAGNAEYRAFHAAVLQRLTLHKEAVAEYQAALRLAPQAGVWWLGMGISLEADGLTSEARAAYERARATGALSDELSAFVDRKLRQLP